MGLAKCFFFSPRQLHRLCGSPRTRSTLSDVSNIAGQLYKFSSPASSSPLKSPRSDRSPALTSLWRQLKAQMHAHADNITTYRSFPPPGIMVTVPYPVDSEGRLIDPSVLKDHAVTNEFNLPFCFHKVPANVVTCRNESSAWYGHTVAACGIGRGELSCGFWLSFTDLTANTEKLLVQEYPLRKAALTLSSSRPQTIDSPSSCSDSFPSTPTRPKHKHVVNVAAHRKNLEAAQHAARRRELQRALQPLGDQVKPIDVDELDQNHPILSMSAKRVHSSVAVPSGSSSTASTSASADSAPAVPHPFFTRARVAAPGYHVVPPRGTVAAICNLLDEPGLSAEQFETLFVFCQACRHYMVGDVFDDHTCNIDP
ncbi:hypothetical protein HGRIS_002281 [Hohenbuehelia grisea]|uniref:Uncharacterized protein n=1 Tax=Hohenbuehelia grisea TaxID=104357 RepID=A0ABR3JL57_9AGAR